MEGEDILSVQEIKRRSKTLSSDYMHIKTVKEGSIIICLDVESSAFTSLGFFLELIETLLSTVLQRNHDSNNDSTSCVIISLDFMDTNNESLVFRKPLSDRKELMGSFPQIKEERELLHEENMRRIFMYDRQEFDLCLHDIARYLNVGNSLCTLQTEHAYVSSNKRRERRNEYERPNKMAKLLIEDEGNLMAKMSNVDDMVLQTTVDNCTSPAARITPIYSDKSVPERVQIKQEPKNDSEDSEDVCDCGIFHKTFDSLQIFEQHKRKCRAEFVVRHTTATQMMYIRDDDKDRRLKTDLQTIIDNEVRIFLIGKCGAGRSATGNTLLGENKFPSGLSPQPVTLQFCFGTKNYKSRNIIVVDGPGLIFDSNFTAENMKKELAKATALLAPGPNAFLFVVGLNKFGESEMKAIEMYKKAFGEELMNYLIVVYTEGDTLERNNLSIQDYVLKFEDGRVKSLFASCENRYCSINNVGTAYIKERDANNLLDMIFALEKQNERKIYQNSQFIIAEKEIDKRLKERVNKSPKSLNYDDLLNLRASARNEILQGASWVNALIGTLILGFGAAFAYFIGGPGAVVAGAAIFSRYAAKK
ncbi:uncharacterized protein LOC143072193 isoform X2 [Mytilus galloprovincialis]|uniref:uncharacterized protein LOC143072193 isoform X2 n=1 Tax=Mytilus galloprovincialis TaxID=29158 RepID=UPI003F7C19CE